MTSMRCGKCGHWRAVDSECQNCQAERPQAGVIPIFGDVSVGGEPGFGLGIIVGPKALIILIGPFTLGLAYRA